MPHLLAVGVVSAPAAVPGPIAVRVVFAIVAGSAAAPGPIAVRVVAATVAGSAAAPGLPAVRVFVEPAAASDPLVAERRAERPVALSAKLAGRRL